MKRRIKLPDALPPVDHTLVRRVDPRMQGPLVRPPRESLYDMRREYYESIRYEMKKEDAAVLGTVAGSLLHFLIYGPVYLLKAVLGVVVWIFKNAGQLLSAALFLSFMGFLLLVAVLVLKQKGM